MPTRWLFSPRTDVLAFGGSALLSFMLIAIGYPLGLVHGDTPEWAWIACVLLIDVAHVWGNLLLIYTDPVELRRRPLLYAAVPLVGLAVGAALASESELWLWRALAYLAVIHFVRQQVGWVKLYGGSRLDIVTTYTVTLAPILWWHAHLPQPFAWLVQDDFIVFVPEWIGTAALAVEGVVVALFLCRAATAGGRAFEISSIARRISGKDIVIVTTAICWWLGIVALRSDYAFTVTNVLIHGIPYMVLIAWTARRRRELGLSLAKPLAYGAGVLVAVLWTCALVEELLWDSLVWHERGWTAFVDVGAARPYLVALLALPQLTHYVLDGFLWRRDDRILPR